MKTIALLCMLIDHIGLMFFPDQLIWRVIGRLAMPVFAFCLARGAYYTSSMKGYLKKMGIFALVSQIPYWWVETLAFGEPFPSFHFNIGFTFFGALMIIVLLQKCRKEERELQLLEWVTLVVILFMAEIFAFDYGAYGILVVLLCDLLNNRMHKLQSIGPFLIGYTLLTFLAYMNNIGGFLLQEIGVFGFVIVFLFEKVSEKRISRLFYVFYPLHLFILCMIKWGMSR